MNNIKRKVARLLAIMLSVMLAIPNTAIAQYFGFGMMEAFAEATQPTINIGGTTAHTSCEDIPEDDTTNHDYYRVVDSTDENVTLTAIKGAEGDTIKIAVDGGAEQESSTVSIGGSLGEHTFTVKESDSDVNNPDIKEVSGTVTLYLREAISVVTSGGGNITYDGEPVTLEDFSITGNNVNRQTPSLKFFKEVDSSNEEIEAPTIPGSYFVKAFIGLDTNNFVLPNETDYVNFNIVNDTATVKTVPVIKTGLISTGDPVDLITAGAGENGTMKYAVSQTDLNATDNSLSYETDVPTGTAGTYYVYYYVEGDEYYRDTDKTKLGSVTVETDSGNTIAISGTAAYNQTLTANITDTDKKFEDKSITYTWSLVKGEETSTIGSNASTLSISDGTWIGGRIKVSAKVDGYAAITSDETSAIAKATLTPSLTGTFSKEYDGSTDVEASDAESAIISLEGKKDGDEVDLAAGITYKYEDASAGTHDVVSSTLSLTGANKDYYTLGDNTTVSEEGTIKEKSLAIDDNVEFSEGYYLSKTTTQEAFFEVGTVVLKSGIIEGDDVTINMDSVDLGEASWTTPGTLTGTVTFILQGEDAGNYQLASAEKSITCVINGIISALDAQKVISAIKTKIDEAPITKVYNGTTTGGDVSITQEVDDKTYNIAVSYVYNNKDAGDYKKLTFTGLVATDTDSKPYSVQNETTIISNLNSLTGGNAITGSITPKELTQSNLTITNDKIFTKTYDGDALSPSDTTMSVTVMTNALIEGDEAPEVTVTGLSFGTTNVFSETDGTATLSLSGTNYDFADGEDVLDVKGSITEKALIISPAVTLEEEFGSGLIASIEAEVEDNAVKAKSTDALDLTLTFSETDESSSASADITKDGTYYIFITNTGNTNYTAPSGSVGTVKVIPQEVEASAIIINDVTPNKFEYGETIKARITNKDDALKGANMKVTWIFTPASGSPTEVDGGVVTLNTSSEQDIQLALTNADYIGKTISFAGKVDGYAAVRDDGDTITIKARTLTPSAIGGTTTKTYDGNNTVTDLTSLTVAGADAGKYGAETVVIKANTAEFASALAGTEKDVKVTAFELDGNDAAKYRIDPAVTELTGTGVGTISQKKLTADQVIVPDSYSLIKTTGETTYTEKGDPVVLAEGAAVSGETLTLEPDLAQDNISLVSGTHSEAGSYKGKVTYTLTGSTASNYTFSNDISVQTIEKENIDCLVTAISSVTADEVTGAIDSKLSETTDALDKVYNSNSEKTLTVQIGEVDFTCEFEYSDKNAGEDKALTLTSIDARQHEGTTVYSLANESDIKTAIAAKNYTGSITPKEIDNDDLENATSLTVTKEYDGGVITLQEVKRDITNLGVSASALIEGDTCAVVIDSASFTGDDGDVNNSLSGTIQLSLDNTNYTFVENSGELAVTGVITAKELTFKALESPVTFSTAANTVQAITSDAESKIKNLIDGDTTTVTLKFAKEGAATGTAVSTITTVGSYDVYVDQVVNTNYSAPAAKIGTIQVIYGALSGTVVVEKGSSVITTATVGDSLTAEVKDAPDSATNLSYQWYLANGEDVDFITGANAATYTVAAADYDKKLGVIVTDSNYTESIGFEFATAVASKSVAVTANDFTIPASGSSLDFDGKTTRPATITSSSMESGYYGNAEITFASANVGAAPVSVGQISVYDSEGKASGAYTLTYDASGIATDFSATLITKLTVANATPAGRVKTNVGTAEQTFDLTSSIDTGIIDAVSTVQFGMVTTSGDVEYLDGTPEVSKVGNSYFLSYALASSAESLNENKTVSITVPVTDGTNYEQNISLTLTIMAAADTIVTVTQVNNSSDQVTYWNSIVPTVTASVTAGGESLTPSASNTSYTYYDSNNDELSDKPVNVGSYTVVATYDDGIHYGESAPKPFTIVPGTLTGNMFTVNPTTVVMGSNEPGFVWSPSGDQTLGGTPVMTAKYSTATGDSNPAKTFSDIAEEGTYYVYLSVSGATNYTSVTDLEVVGSITVVGSVVPPEPGPGPSEPVAVTGVTVAPKTASLDLADNKTVQLTATVAPSDATDKTLTWTASPADAVSFSSTTANPVTVTALKSGTVTITATTNDGSKTDTATITIAEKPKAATPTFTPAPGSYSEKQNVTIATTTAGAVIYYTVDGTEPTTASTAYTAPIAVEKTTTIKAIAVKDGMDNSEVATGKYEITNKVSAPTFSPAAGTYTVSQNVVISTETAGAVIHYTTDDSTPTENSLEYKSPILVEKTTTIKAIAVKEGMDKSDVATAKYIIDEKAIPVESVSVAPATISILKGETAKLSATVLPKDATSKAVTWKSGDEKIATVTKDGVVKGIAAGTVTITAEAGGKTGSASVTVTEDAAKEKIINEIEEDTKVEIAEDLEGETISQIISTTDGDNTVVLVDGKGEIVETKVWVGGVASSYTYTGKEIKPEPHVYDGTTKLVKDTDYTVSYKNNKAAGTATLEVKFKGNYKNDPQKVNFTIAKADLAEDILITAPAIEAGKATKPTFSFVMKSTGSSVTSGKFNVPADKITLAEGESKDVVITAKDANFTGEATVTVEAAVKANLLSKASFKFNPKKYTYTGEEIEPADSAYLVKVGTKALTKGTDYDVKEILNNVEPGKATVVIEGMGDYKGEKSASFTIEKGKNVNDLTVTVNNGEDVFYAKGGVTPPVSVELDDGTRLVNDTDYTLKFNNNKAAGNASVKVTLKGKYKGEKTANFEIKKQNLSNLSIVVEDKVKSNSKDFYKKPKVIITDLNGKKLTSTDYTIGTDYEYDEENGTVTVSCTAKGNYESDEGFKLEYRVITASQNIAKAKAAKIADQIYTGRAITLTEKDLENILTLNNKALVAGTDFEIDETSYLKNVKKGTATFVVKGIGDSGGVKTLKFKIVQKTIKWNGSYVDGKFTK